jgi:hypothetical protein
VVEAVLLAAAAAARGDDDCVVGVGGRTAVAEFVAAPMGDADRYVVVVVAAAATLEAVAPEIAMGGGEKDRLRGDRCLDDGC